MKILNPNCFDVKKLSLLAQIISFLYNGAYLNFFLNNFDRFLEYNGVSYTMVYTTCLKNHIFTPQETDQAGSVKRVSKGGTLL